MPLTPEQIDRLTVRLLPSEASRVTSPHVLARWFELALELPTGTLDAADVRALCEAHNRKHCPPPPSGGTWDDVQPSGEVVAWWRIPL